jgi:hypothetical protein
VSTVYIEFTAERAGGMQPGTIYSHGCCGCRDRHARALWTAILNDAHWAAEWNRYYRSLPVLPCYGTTGPYRATVLPVLRYYGTTRCRPTDGPLCCH